MVGKIVQQYQFIERLGAGGMGEIYKAQDTRLNRFVAIKVLTSETAGDPERRRRFLQEAQAASALNHPNIITIHDIAQEGDSQFMVMENVQGKTLADLIPKGGLRTPQVLKYSVQMADALAAAHTAGIIHRDLKPGNVMVTETGLVKVLDFGLAKLTDRSPLGSVSDDATRTIADAPLTVEGAIIGTVSYMSPEQAQGRKIDPRSDVFSMGLVIYEMATGTRAFHGDSALSTLSSILRDEPRAVHEIAPDVPPELEQVIARCLRKAPDDRWQTMLDLQRALAALKHESDSGVLYRSRLGGPATAPPPSFPQSGVQSQIVTGQRPATQASQNWTQPPSAASSVQPSVAGAPPSVSAPLMQNPGGQPPPLAQKSSMGLVLGLGGAALALALGGGAWWMMHRAPAETTESQEPVQTAKVEPPTAQPAPEPVVTPEAKAPEPAKQPDAKQATTAKSEPPKAEAPKADSKAAPVASTAAAKAKAPVATKAPSTPVAPAATPVEPPAQAKAAVAAVVPRNTATVTVPDGRPFLIQLAADVPNDAAEGTILHFTAKDDFRIGDAVIVSKGAAITGQIVNGGKKRIIASTKMTLRLVDAEINGGGKLHLRALPGRRPDGNYERPVDTGVKKTRDVVAMAGTDYVAYVDNEQSISVRK